MLRVRPFSECSTVACQHFRALIKHAVVHTLSLRLESVEQMLANVLDLVVLLDYVLALEQLEVDWATMSLESNHKGPTALSSTSVSIHQGLL